MKENLKMTCWKVTEFIFGRKPVPAIKVNGKMVKDKAKVLCLKVIHLILEHGKWGNQKEKEFKLMILGTDMKENSQQVLNMDLAKNPIRMETFILGNIRMANLRGKESTFGAIKVLMKVQSQILFIYIQEFFIMASGMVVGIYKIQMEVVTKVNL